MREHILKIVTVVLALFLCGMLWWDHTEEQKRQEYYRQIEIEARPLRLEQSDLETQLADLKRNYQNKLTGTASLELLLTEPSSEFVNVIEPLMAEQELTGVLALSKEQLSGQSEMPDDDRLEELLGKGWSWCLYYGENQNQNISEWLAEAVNLSTEHGLPEPKAVYFKADTYSFDYDTQLQEAGITILIHHGEEELPLIADAGEEADALWKVGACGWNGDGTSDRLRNIMSQGRNLVFTVGTDTSGEAFESSQFKSMVSTLKNYEQQGSLTVTGLEQAREHLIMQPDNNGQEEADYEKQKEELEQQIDELKQQIDDIYTKGR